LDQEAIRQFPHTRNKIAIEVGDPQMPANEAQTSRVMNPEATSFSSPCRVTRKILPSRFSGCVWGTGTSKSSVSVTKITPA
jgi:hypothetical protein